MKFKTELLRRIKWILVLFLFFAGFYFSPYEIYYQSNFNYILLTFSAVFAVVVYQIYGNYSSIVEFLDSFLKPKQPIFSMCMSVIVAFILYFVIMLHHNAQEQEELRCGIKIKAKIIAVEQKYQRRAFSWIFSSKKKKRYLVHYEYKMKDTTYYGKSIVGEDVLGIQNYSIKRKPDSIDIVVSKKHNTLSAIVSP